MLLSEKNCYYEVKFIAKVGEVTKEKYVFDLRKGVNTQKLKKIELRKN